MLWLLVVPLLWRTLRDSPEALGLQPDGASASHLSKDAIPLAAPFRIIPGTATREALRSAPFWLLSGSYFACGFTDFILYTHFPIFAVGIGVPEQTAANLTGLIGGLSILGVVGMGAWTDRIGWRTPLTLIYLMRGVGLGILTFTKDFPMLMAFVLVYGFFHFASTPLTPAAAAGIYGRRPLATIYGYLHFSHALGSVLGPYLAGSIFEQTGGYGPAFLLTAGVLLSASLSCSFLKGPRKNP
jgi:predicted MFS family arabinose efflux permease